jgi:hypothetical protein
LQETTVNKKQHLVMLLTFKSMASAVGHTSKNSVRNSGHQDGLDNLTAIIGAHESKFPFNEI